MRACLHDQSCAAGITTLLEMIPGMRFSGGADTTVKLCEDMVYTLQISSSPAVAFRQVEDII